MFNLFSFINLSSLFLHFLIVTPPSDYSSLNLSLCTINKLFSYIYIVCQYFAFIKTDFVPDKLIKN